MNNYKKCSDELIKLLDTLLKLDLDMLDKYARKELEEAIQHLYRASILLKLLHEEQL